MHTLSLSLAVIAVLVTQAAAQPSARGLYSDYNYCQGITPVAHRTYKPVENATLRKVQVMMRHGDRTPSEVLPGDDTLYDICSHPAEYSFMATNDHNLRKTSSPILKSKILVSDENLYVAAGSYWRGNCEVGQLTNKGSSQTKQVGKHLRAIYVDQLQFLPRYLNPDDLYVRNTYISRTKASAVNFLTGLYPHHRRKGDAVVVMNTYPEPIETLILNRSACPRLRQLYDAFVRTPTYTEHLKRNHALMQKVNSVLGVSHLSKYNSTLNGDFVVPRYCNSLPLGCSAQEDPASCLTAKEVVEAVTESTFHLSGLFRYEEIAEEVKRLAVGPFLKTFTASIRATVAQKSTKRGDQQHQRVRPFEFYSAHDQSLDQVLSIIAEPNTPWPAYASTLIFETWTRTRTTKNNSSSKSDDVIRVLYEGKVVPAHPKMGCTLDACPLETFLQFVENYIPTDITTECSPI
ncbi:Acid phosphatase-like protein 2 [Mortierella antarctica]|nr:Acid phosphatase-like protein 2 [Mortierella antarctica]